MKTEDLLSEKNIHGVIASGLIGPFFKQAPRFIRGEQKGAAASRGAFSPLMLGGAAFRSADISPQIPGLETGAQIQEVSLIQVICLPRFQA